MKKIQKDYRFLFPALVLGLMLMFTACQKEEVVEAVQSNQETMEPDSHDSELPTAAFTKQLQVALGNGQEVLLEVGASDQSLLDQLKAEDFKIGINSKPKIMEMEGHQHESTKSGLATYSDRFISVQVLGIHSNAQISGYSIEFSEGLQTLLRREKIAMRIILAPSELDSTHRISGYWARTNTCLRLICIGDGGQITTKVNVWKRTSTYSHTIAHTMQFLFAQSCTACEHTNCYRLDDVWVYDDVLWAIHIWNQC